MSLLEILSSPQLTEGLRLEIMLRMYPLRLAGENKNLNRLYLKILWLRISIGKTRCQFTTQRTKVVTHLLKKEFIFNCHFRLATLVTIYYIPGFLQITTMLLNAIIKEISPGFPNSSICFISCLFIIVPRLMRILLNSLIF